VIDWHSKSFRLGLARIVFSLSNHFSAQSLEIEKWHKRDEICREASQRRRGKVFESAKLRLELIKKSFPQVIASTQKERARCGRQPKGAKRRIISGSFSLRSLPPFCCRSRAEEKKNYNVASALGRSFFHSAPNTSA
jgi:hypothetical protein